MPRIIRNVPEMQNEQLQRHGGQKRLLQKTFQQEDSEEVAVVCIK